MKTKILTISLMTGLSLTTTGIAASPAASGGSAAAARAVPAVTPNQTTPGRIVPPGTRPGNPGGPVNGPVNPIEGINGVNDVNGNSTTTVTSNSPIAATPTNQFQATSNATANINSNPSPNNLAVQDQTVTSGDRMLLNTLQQGLAAQLGTSAGTVAGSSTTTAAGTSAGTSTAGAASVHFLINNGMVTLVGTVPTADESQRILARVQQTPGVVSVFNDLRVGNAATTSAQPINNLTGTAGVSDRAFTPADQTLLTVVEQAAGNQLGITGASTGQMPVHFSIQNGVVGVTGQLSSPQEKAAVLAAVRQTPGVVRVVDNVALINVPQNGGVPGASPLQTPPMNNQTRPLQPTSRSMGLTNSQFLNTSNQQGF